MGSGQLGHLIARYAGWVDAAIFAGLAVVGIRNWWRRRTTSGLWVAALAAAITAVVIAGALLGGRTEAARGGELWAVKAMIAVLALFPYFLYRFMRSFARAGALVETIAVCFTTIIVTWSLLLPEVPARGSTRGIGFMVFVIAFLVHWTVMSSIVAWFFWHEGARSVGVARRRLRLFAVASMLMTIAILASGAAPGRQEEGLLNIAIQIGAVAAAVLFLSAYAPPRVLRAVWRTRETGAYQEGIRRLLEAMTMEEVTRSLLPFAVRMVGGRGALLLDEHGVVIGSWGTSDVLVHRFADAVARGERTSEWIMHPYDRGGIVVIVSPVTPVFGRDEMAVLDTVAGFASLALHRAEAFDRERETNERLKQVDQLKNEFVAMVAHDIRSPMTVISGFADTMQQQWQTLPDAQKLEFLELISRNTRTLAEFVGDVLQVARIESGELDYELKPFDAKAVVRRIIDEHCSASEGVELQLEAPDDLPLAYGDEERNWQILTNLVSNAIKFSPEHPRIGISIRADAVAGTIELAVDDHGRGIAQEDIPKLFKKFSRIGAGRQPKGTGLGLYIVKSMVEAQGGRVWVESRPGEGSTFRYTLPVAHCC